MASRNFYFQLILRVLLITSTSIALAISYVNQWFLATGILAILLVSQTYFLITFINSTNRKIAYFFDAIKNEDFTLRFPERVSIESFKELNRSLNRVNGLIQEVHLQLQIREQYYQQILKQANIGIMTFNKKGHILFSNPTLEKLLNYKPLNHIKQLAQVDQSLYEIFAKLEPFDRELVQLTNEREKTHLAVKATSMSLDRQSLLLVTVQDIHKELDEKETDSWIRLIRVLNHEIMNTITPITSISESILKYYQPKDGLAPSEYITEDLVKNTAKGLGVIQEQGRNLMDFVQSYRSFLSLPPPDKTLVPAQKLLDNVKTLMDQQSQNNAIYFEAKADPVNLELFIDEKQISQILINLCKNASQSLEGKEKGTIKILSGTNEIGKKFIEVWDNGPGIPEDLIDEIFVPFFTTKNAGTGIGLSLSKQIMHLHGGNIKVRSVPNRETSFLLTF
ncbi:sensor histidine kinase [Ulvibacterium marinum]|uniref:histidine kinase n=1 Tax=Ulvibacterium marinum TaxID=2419782 RepID=A0A3B0CHG6_9FLAO|nr:ATP-binding protein [Ulvibacterium marinum]RKN82886.1 histidine kinase [Ulvibacterium marinum]